MAAEAWVQPSEPHSVQWRGAPQRVLVAAEAAAAEAAAQALCGPAEAGLVLGLDTEWGEGRRVAVLQLAGPGGCLLCLLPGVELRACPTLFALLAAPDVVKAGVGIAQDAALLQEQFQIDVRGCLDLFLLAAREERVPAAQPCGLAHLARLLLDVKLPKEDAVRCGDWSLRPLSAEQVGYAARDALAGRDCAEALWGERAEAAAGSMAQWCAELLDRLAKVRAGPAVRSALPEKAECRKAAAILQCSAYSSTVKFGDRPVVDSDGRTMLHMRERTVEGLLRRGLASLVELPGGQAVRLHFSPEDHYAYAGMDAAERNACVSCGDLGVARFYIVPRVFFTHLPRQCKSYNCHDVVMVCPACRLKAEPPQHDLVQELLAQHGALRAGDRYANENPLAPEQALAKGAAAALLRAPSGGRKGTLPAAKEEEFRRAVAAALAVPPAELGRAHLERAAALGEGPLPSERICQAACADEASLRFFLRRWRELFLEALKPRFLADGWAVDTGLDGRFVPSVAATLEWPGDWRCAGCGVHCFGSRDACRSCGSLRSPRSASA